MEEGEKVNIHRPRGSRGRDEGDGAASQPGAGDAGEAGGGGGRDCLRRAVGRRKRPELFDSGESPAWPGPSGRRYWRVTLEEEECRRACGCPLHRVLGRRRMVTERLCSNSPRVIKA